MVPDGVSTIDIALVGANGASIFQSVGGSGARVEGTLNVTPGETLHVLVGGNAYSKSGGFNGGGGGAGVDAAAGGDAGEAGSWHPTRCTVDAGGGAGTDISGGTGGSCASTPSGTAGTLAQGGTGGAYHDTVGAAIGGGGGGGGLYGGGGGAGNGYGGGGGGSSLVPVGGSFTLSGHAALSASIEFTMPINTIIVPEVNAPALDTAAFSLYTLGPSGEQVSLSSLISSMTVVTALPPATVSDLVCTAVACTAAKSGEFTVMMNFGSSGTTALGRFIAERIPQTISFTGSSLTVGETLTPTGSSTSALPVVYTVIDGPCKLAAGGVVGNAAGTCTVEATQSGDALYSAATPVTVVFTVAPAPAGSGGSGAASSDTLANTGPSDSMPAVFGALLALLSGTALLTIGRLHKAD